MCSETKKLIMSDIIYLIYGLIALLVTFLIRIFDGVWIVSMLIAGIILTILGIVYIAYRLISK